MIITILIILCHGSILWADDIQPRDLGAVAGDGVVYLHWSSSKKEVAGYWVYRALPNGNYQKVNLHPLKKPFYEDRNVVNGQFYWYTLTVIDHEGNEGPASKTIAVTPHLHGRPLIGY